MPALITEVLQHTCREEPVLAFYIYIGGAGMVLISAAYSL